MEYVCPICNGIQSVVEHCSQCGAGMLDGGVLTNYVGPYSPYMELNRDISSNSCIHLLYCPHCHNDMHQAYPLMWL